jgi:hypothetical protein
MRPALPIRVVFLFERRPDLGVIDDVSDAELPGIVALTLDVVDRLRGIVTSDVPGQPKPAKLVPLNERNVGLIRVPQLDHDISWEPRVFAVDPIEVAPGLLLGATGTAGPSESL